MIYKKPLFSILILMLILANSAFGQHARFTTEGSIEFEKSVNMHALIKKNMNKDNEFYYVPAFEEFKKTQAQFKVLKSMLVFSKDKTLFTPEPVDVSVRTWFSDIPASTQNNIIYTDLSSATSIVQKSVFEEVFLVSDSTRKITWKITSETREIAGYNCRRANAIIMDSIYVVAFYTDEIPVSGGPESFTGLPGMILGLAMPYENISWFAKQVFDKPIAAGAIIAPKKGKPIDNKGLLATLTKAMKSLGTYAQNSLKSFLL
jgi:GLPGLI family protein